MDHVFANDIPSSKSLHRYGGTYVRLTKSIGWIGILLTPVLAVGNWSVFHDEPLMHSISRYYYTSMRDFFVGGMSAMALFLVFHRGRNSRENWNGNLAGIFSLGVAVFPVAPADESWGASAIVHYSCAIGLFCAMATFSLGFFGRRKDTQDPVTRWEAMLHRICGTLVLGCIAAILHHALAVDCDKTECRFVIIVEFIALLAFGLSWLVECRRMATARSWPRSGRTRSYQRQ